MEKSVFTGGAGIQTFLSARLKSYNFF